MTVPRVREIHNLSIVSLGGDVEVSLHLKLPGDLPLDQAHEIAEQVERAIVNSVPEITSVQTHLEPIAEVGAGELVEAAEIEAAAERAAGGPVRELRLLRTEKGVVAFITLGPRPGHDARRCALVGERSRGAAAPRTTRCRRRDRPHRTVRLCMFTPAGSGARARLARPDRGRHGRPARGADAAVLLHGRLGGARARRVQARRRAAARVPCSSRPGCGCSMTRAASRSRTRMRSARPEP